jgi:hypothetical protein
MLDIGVTRCGVQPNRASVTRAPGDDRECWLNRGFIEEAKSTLPGPDEFPFKPDESRLAESRPAESQGVLAMSNQGSLYPEEVRRRRFKISGQTV